MRHEPTHAPHVAAKQILVHGDFMFLVDAAGQLWVTHPYRLGKVEAHPVWQRIELPHVA